MRKIINKEFTLDDFSHEHLMFFKSSNDYELENGYIPFSATDALMFTIDMMNNYRSEYLNTDTDVDRNGTRLSEEACAKIKKELWWQIVQLLPSSYNQTRTIMLNYEVLANIYNAYKHAELDEWREFHKWIKTLPYNDIITCSTEEE